MKRTKLNPNKYYVYLEHYSAIAGVRGKIIHNMTRENAMKLATAFKKRNMQAWWGYEGKYASPK